MDEELAGQRQRGSLCRSILSNDVFERDCHNIAAEVYLRPGRKESEAVCGMKMSSYGESVWEDGSMQRREEERRKEEKKEGKDGRKVVERERSAAKRR